jgi:hypothetical protein
MPERFRRDTVESSVAADRPATGEREGLPPGYRMRADAHYVDQLTARSPDAAVRSIAIDEIDAAPIDVATIQPLTRAIVAHGVLQPLLVRREDSRFRVIAGRKRLAAARAAGLPVVPCFTHQVDDAGAELLAQAENTRGNAPDTRVGAGGLLDPESVLLKLADDLHSIEAAASLLASRGLPTSRRVTVDLIRAEAWRALWLIQAGATADRSQRGETRLSVLGTILERVRDGFLPESRLSGVDIQVCVPDWNVSAVVDERSLMAGLTGGIIATLGFVEQAPGAVITLIASAAPGGSLGIDIAQDAVTVPAEVASRLFDSSWTDRPGGWAAIVGALTARAVAQQHGGDAACLVRERRGSTLRLTLDQAR